jgi:DNA modification methylase
MTTIKDLKFDDKNFNKHTEYGMSLLEKSLRENGAGRSILLDKDNNIIAGNGIVEAAGQIGLENVKIVEATGDEIIAVKRTDVSLNSHKGREMALADNATAAVDLAWDDEAIKSEFTEEETKGWGVDLDWNDIEEIEEDEAPEVNESEPADSELGKVYKLGNHRLMCGDSTDAGSVAILMDGEKADMVFTDPPYGVSIKGKYTGGIKNDDLRGEELREFLSKTNSLLENYNKGDAYICYEGRNSLEFFESFGRPNELICINKSSASFYNKNRYNRKFELIMFFGEKINADSEVNVWDTIKSSQLQSVDENGVKFSDPSSFCCVHPTAKPVSVPKRAINNSSRIGEICLDLFGGSGSTLIACEQLGRKCYMMELDPKYCDVIRKRYWKFKTGSEEGWQDGTKATN